MATCAVEVFGVPEDEVRGSRGCGASFPSRCPSAEREEATAARGTAVSALLPLRELRERAGRRGDSRGCLARAGGWGGVGCFREPHFLREPVDSTPRSSLELPPSLSFSFRKWWGAGLGSQQRECAGARAAPRLPLPATPGRVCVSSGRGWGGANFPGA